MKFEAKRGIYPTMITPYDKNGAFDYDASDFASREASLLQDVLGLAAMIETITYPCYAKYHLDRHESVLMEWRAQQ